MNTDELEQAIYMAERRVLEIQTKLHRWASDDPHRRFDDLYNLVTDPAFLLVAWGRVRGNKGARTAGVDGETARYIEAVRGVEGFLAELRADLKARTFRPLPARRRAIPKAGGKVRYLGIATVSSYCLSCSPVSECSGLAAVRPCCRICWHEHGKWCRHFRGSAAGPRAPGCGVEVPGCGDALAAGGLDAVVPGDA